MTADTHLMPSADTVTNAERRTIWVAGLTALAMVVELVAGYAFDSMALLADGWHMGTHAAAIGLSALAYGMSRRYRRDPRFAFGTWKVEVLASFVSALGLLLAAVTLAVASVQRLIDPQPIQHLQALSVAVAGLALNLVCAWLLGPHDHGHSHAHSRSNAHPHDHGHGHGSDLNLRSAYLHVVADAATSALAIAALLGGWLYGWDVLDPLMGLVGAAMILRWGLCLVRESGRALLDAEMDHPVVAELRRRLDQEAPWAGAVRVCDLQVWRIGSDSRACIVRLMSDEPSVTVAAVKRHLRGVAGLDQVTVQIEPWRRVA